MNRRDEPRVQVEVPCKVWHPRAMRFVPGFTRDLSRDGAQITLRGGIPFEQGERIMIGLPPQAGAIVRSSADLLEGTIVRMAIEDGRIAVAVRFGGNAARAESAVDAA
ncbi:MAG: PilZ domain-containing protein [Phycisphaerales bacterium]